MGGAGDGTEPGPLLAGMLAGLPRSGASRRVCGLSASVWSIGCGPDQRLVAGAGALLKAAGSKTVNGLHAGAVAGNGAEVAERSRSRDRRPTWRLVVYGGLYECYEMTSFCFWSIWCCGAAVLRCLPDTGCEEDIALATI